jgi:hypothetical protein
MLTDEERLAFHREVCIDPLQATDKEPLHCFHTYDFRTKRGDRHIDNADVYRLCTDQTVLKRVEVVLGPGLLLYQSCLYVKHSGGMSFDWRHDLADWSKHPAAVVSAWIALQYVCVLMVALSSHKSIWGPREGSRCS